MTKCCQRTSGDFAAEGCHRRRFPVDYRNHEKTYVPATSGNEDSIHNLEADSQADPPANRTRSGHGDQDTLADVHPVEPSSGADLPAAHADGVPERRVRRGGGVLRCVTAEVEYDGKMLEMSFLTNNMEWCARTIAELYRSSAYSRTHVATRIFEHYELAPMRSGMVVDSQEFSRLRMDGRSSRLRTASPARKYGII